MPRIQIQYADFIRFFGVDDPASWAQGFRVGHDGVWVVPPPDDADLLPTERAVLSDHPKRDLSKPALAFPCSLEELHEFISWGGFTGCVIQGELESFLKKQERANESHETFVQRMKRNGKTPEEIARALIEKDERITDHELGRLLPSNPHAQIKYHSVRKKGQRLRNKVKKQKD